MNGIQLGRVHRTIRVRLRLRQQDVAQRCGVRREKISRIERGLLLGVSLEELDRCFSSLGAHVDVRVAWRGAEIDRLLDEGHARLAGQVMRLLEGWGWQVVAEVTFAHFGERGSIDLLAWHARLRVLLIVEIKTELASVEGLLRPLDVKVRNAPRVARERFGWQPRTVARLVVMPEDRTARRRVERHDRVLRTALPLRSHDVRRWLREPTGQISGLWFLTDAAAVHTKRNPAAVRRVRRAAMSADAAR